VTDWPVTRATSPALSHLVVMIARNRSPRRELRGGGETALSPERHAAPPTGRRGARGEPWAPPRSGRRPNTRQPGRVGDQVERHPGRAEQELEGRVAERHHQRVDDGGAEEAQEEHGCETAENHHAPTYHAFQSSGPYRSATIAPAARNGPNGNESLRPRGPLKTSTAIEGMSEIAKAANSATPA